MKTATILGLALVGLTIAFLGVQWLGAPLIVVLGIIGLFALLLRRKLRTDPYVGWGYCRVAGVIAALTAGAWAGIAFMSGNVLLGLPLAAILAGAVLWIRYCNKRIAAAVSRPASTGGVSSAAAGIPTPGFQNLLDQSSLGMQTLANNRRSAERGKAMHAQRENLDLTRKNRELQAEVDRLKQQASGLQDALEDPFYDPPAGSRQTGV